MEESELDDTWVLGLSTIYPPPPAESGVEMKKGMSRGDMKQGKE
jgi:hypothetical protein